MRVSERQRHAVAINRMETAKRLNSDAMSVLSTQELMKVEDDPIGMTQVIRGRHALRKMDSFLDNIKFSKGFLSVSETALQGVQNNLQRAREVAVAMANDSYALDSRESVAREISEIINEVINLGTHNLMDTSSFRGLGVELQAFSL